MFYPPADTDYFRSVDIDKEYFLCVSRLVPYKRIDFVVEVLNELGFPLVVIGGGSEFEKIKAMTKDYVKMLGRESNEVMKEHYAKYRVFIFPGEENFGITPVEAKVRGCPVIAYGNGDTLETVIY